MTDTILNFGNYFTDDAITFDQTEIELKTFYRHKTLLRIQCCRQKSRNRPKKVNFIISKVQILKTLCIALYTEKSFQHFYYLFT